MHKQTKLIKWKVIQKKEKTVYHCYSSCETFSQCRSLISPPPGIIPLLPEVQLVWKLVLFFQCACLKYTSSYTINIPFWLHPGKFARHFWTSCGIWLHFILIYKNRLPLDGIMAFCVAVENMSKLNPYP